MNLVKIIQNDALHINAENEPAVKTNEAVLNNLPGELYMVETNYKIPDNCKYLLPTIQAAQNQNQGNTGNLAKLVKRKNGCKSNVYS